MRDVKNADVVRDSRAAAQRNWLTFSQPGEVMFDRVMSGVGQAALRVDTHEHELTLNDNIAAIRAIHRKKQRFPIMCRAACAVGVSMHRQRIRRENRNMSPSM